MPDVGSAKLPRQQHLDRLAQQRLAAVAEHLFGLRVDQHNFPFPIDDDNRVRRRFQQSAEERLRGFGLQFVQVDSPRLLHCSLIAWIGCFRAIARTIPSGLRVFGKVRSAKIPKRATNC
jgi:hypothetical protein